MTHKKILIFALLTAAAVSLQAQTDSIETIEKNIVGIWHFPNDRMLMEITETQFGQYGGVLSDYKIIGQNKISNGKGRILEFEMFDHGKKLMFVDGGEKHYAEKITVQPNTKYVGKYVTDKPNETSITYIEILEEGDALVGNHLTKEAVPMQYVELGQKLLYFESGYYGILEIKEGGFLMINPEDSSEVGFYERTDDFDTYQSDYYYEEVTEAVEIETEETTNKKSFKVSYPQSGRTTKYTVENIGLEVDKPIIYVRFWEENYIDGEWRYASSKAYYLYYKENKIQKIEEAGLSWNCLEDNPREWVIAFKKFANELPSMLDKRTKDVKKIRKLLWDSGKDIPEWTETYRDDWNEREAITVEKEPQEIESDTVEVNDTAEVDFIYPAEEETETATDKSETRTTTISVAGGTVELELTEGADDFRCIGIRLSDNNMNMGMGTYMEIKKRNGFYITNAWDGKKYATIAEAIKEELEGMFKRFYEKKYKKRGKEAWSAFVSEGGWQLFLNFANEIIDDEFLNSPFNEIYG